MKYTIRSFLECTHYFLFVISQFFPRFSSTLNSLFYSTLKNKKKIKNHLFCSLPIKNSECGIFSKDYENSSIDCEGIFFS